MMNIYLHEFKTNFRSVITWSIALFVLIIDLSCRFFPVLPARQKI